MNVTRCIAVVALVLFLSTPVAAESIAGADKFICATILQEICASDQPCTNGGPAWDTGLPEFLEVDVKQKAISTTQASGTDRSSKVDLRRDNGLIIMQSYELGKALSILINESTGIATASVTSDGEVITVFAACTPR